MQKTISTEQTLNFLKQYLALPTSSTLVRILEVGCGKNPLLARCLAELGYDVTGIDPCVDRSHEGKKLRLFTEDFLEWKNSNQEVSSFDVVIFTKSLHHIPQLEKALALAKSLAKKGGLVIVEDVYREKVDEKSATWFFGTVDCLKAAGLEFKFENRSHHHGQHSHHQEHHSHHSANTDHTHAHHSHHPNDAKIHDHQKDKEKEKNEGKDEVTQLQPLARLARIFQHHNPPLHEGQLIISQIEKMGLKFETFRVPFFYHLFDEVNPNVSLAVFKMEQKLVELNVLLPIGFNVVITVN